MNRYTSTIKIVFLCLSIEEKIWFYLKGPLSQFVATLNPLKMMKNAFDFTLKLYLFLRYLEFCPDFSRHIGKQLDKKIYDIANWKTNNYNTHIARYLRK